MCCRNDHKPANPASNKKYTTMITMMNQPTKSTISLATAMGCLALATGFANAALISIGDGLTVTASEESNSFHKAEKTIDESGLSSGLHSTGTRVGWLTDGGTAIADQWIQWDLGDAYVLDSVQVWNYNHGSYDGSGMREVDIYVSAAAAPDDPEGAGAANWIKIGDNVSFTVAPALSTYAGFDLETVVGNILPNTAVQFVRFEVNSTHFSDAPSVPTNWTTGVGLAEIQFFTGPDDDTTPPTIASTSPADGAGDVEIDANLVATFSEDITLVDGGTVTIRNLGPGLDPDVVITLPDARVSVSGRDLTINPASDLATSNSYAVQISADAIKDLATTPHTFAGILIDDTWNFFTEVAGPAIASVSPADGAFAVASSTNLTVTFNESISIGTGSITIKNLSDGAGADIAINVTDAGQVSVAGQVLTINPTANLAINKQYAVQIESGAVTDSSGDPFAGILAADITTWNFATGLTGTDYKVLLIGDLISIGYTNPVRGFLNGIATVTHNAGNAQHTGVGLENLQDWLGTETWDVIHFNWGLWDLARRNGPNVTITLAQYEVNLNLLVTQLKATNARLVWANTTYVPEGESIRQFGDDLLYNAVAAQVMAQQGVLINDLNTLTRSFPASYFVAPGDVHYTTTGYSLIGQQVADSIVAALINGFANWIDGFGLDPDDKGFDADPDGDNLANGLEAWFGTHPGQFSSGLANVSSTGLTTTFTHPQNTSPPDDLTGHYEWSPNLTDWYPSGDGPSGGPVITFTTSTSGSTTTVTATASASEGTERIFLRAGVSQN